MTSKQGLTRFLNIPGGITVEMAESNARLRLDGMHDRAIADLQAQLDCMGGYLILLRGVPPHAVREELYRLAYCVASIAGTFGRERLGQAAVSMCELFDNLRDHGMWVRERVDVHYNAMRLLLEARPPAEEAALIAGLRRVADRMEHVHL